MGERGNDHNIILGAAFRPTVEGYDLVLIIGMSDLDKRPRQPLRIAVKITPQVDQITVETLNALERFQLRPVQRLIISEPSILEKFLAFKKHRNSRGG